MSEAHLPSITPIITLTKDEAISLILSSFAMEELALSQILSAEGEKPQDELEALPGVGAPIATISDLLNINGGIRETLEEMVRREEGN
jgi:hypothetical protein